MHVLVAGWGPGLALPECRNRSSNRLQGCVVGMAGDGGDHGCRTDRPAGRPSRRPKGAVRLGRRAQVAHTPARGG